MSLLKCIQKEKVSMSESMWNTYIVQPFIIWSARQQEKELSTVANLGQENTMYYDNVSKKWIDTSEDTDADAANADAPPIANADAPPIGGYPVANIQSTCRRYRS